MSAPFAACSVVGTDIPREKWLASRATGIGASEVASVLGVGFETPADVWLRKTDQASERDLAAEVERIHWGNVLEPAIVSQYATPRYANRPTARSGMLLRSVEHPWALATLDAITMHPDHGAIPLEAKSSDAFAASDWEEGPPERYFLQVQAQLLVTGAPVGSIACLLGGNRLVWTDVERDEATIARIVFACSRFWKLVEAREMPPPDATAEWARAFAVAHPESGAAIKLGQDARPWADELERAKAEAKAIEARVQRAKNELIARIGDASEARFEDGSGFTYRTVHRSGFTVEPTEYRQLRESAAPKKTSKRRAA